MTYFAQQSPWEPYDHPGKGKGKGHPHVPEPAAYGALILALLVVVGAWMRRRR